MFSPFSLRGTTKFRPSLLHPPPKPLSRRSHKQSLHLQKHLMILQLSPIQTKNSFRAKSCHVSRLVLKALAKNQVLLNALNAIGGSVACMQSLYLAPAKLPVARDISLSLKSPLLQKHQWMSTVVWNFSLFLTLFRFSDGLSCKSDLSVYEMQSLAVFTACLHE